MHRVALLLVCLLAMSTPSFAQTGATGAIAGTVRDQTGAIVPAAEVTVRNVATNETRQVPTQTNGSFVVPLLPPGDYTLEVRMGGFAPLTRAGIRVNVTETANLTLDLQLEGVTDTVQVSAAPEIVQSKSNTLGRVVDSRAVEGLPLVTRNYTQIIGLSPGISSDQKPVSPAAGAYSHWRAPEATRTAQTPGVPGFTTVKWSLIAATFGCVTASVKTMPGPAPVA